jgi:predicted glycosyltransferase
MLKKELQAIINEEINFYNKQFFGDDKEEKRQNYLRFIERYYESLGYLTDSSLRLAFKKCREQYEYFPKISQLLKFCPALKKKQPKIDYKALPQSEESKRIMKKAMVGGNKYKIGEEQIRRNFAHLALRWPGTGWDKAIDREIERDSQRLERE